VSAAIKLSYPATRGFWEISVLFEDEHLLALEKPAGLLTSPDLATPDRPDLMKLLHAGIADKKPWARERNLDYLNNAQNPDADTSGVILLAKNKPVFIALANLFSSGKVNEKYVALVRGEPLENQFDVEAKIAPHPVKLDLMRVDSREGKQATTKFEVLENFPRFGYALLKCEPLTNRRHQIRVHAGHVGMNIVGDELYGGKSLWLSRLKKDYRLKPSREERPLISRAALHLEELQFPHPVTNETVTIKSEWPKDLKVAVKYLRQYAN
jgi:23S rRNA pseudouridine955/2504/2580 synthase/23S rRNA pseudouridine1911/1915/1917 synthase